MSEKEPGQGPAKGTAGLLGWPFNLSPKNATIVKFVAVGLALGVLAMSASDLFSVNLGGGRPANSTEVVAPARATGNELTELQEQMSRELEVQLARIQGAGDVHVTISLASGPKAVPVLNTETTRTNTTEKAPDNSTRNSETTTDKENPVMVNSGSSSALAVVQREQAQVAGVLVVADGARDAAVRERLLKATATALKVPYNHIEVQAGTGGGE
jgi:stage III sporulation protein AG